MDELLNNFLSSSSWSDTDVSKRSSWVGNGPAETNGLLPKTRGVYKRDEKSSSISLIPSSHIMESSVQQGPSSLLAVGNSNHWLDESQLQQKSPDHESKPSLNGVMNGNSKAGYMGLRLNTTTSTPSALNLSSPKLLPVADGSAKSPHALPESGSVGSNDSEPSGFQQSRRESHYLPSIPQLWSPPSYGCLASLSPVIEQDKLHGFGLQEEYVDSDANVLGNRYLEDDKTLQLDNLPASISVNGQEEMYSHSLPSFTAGPQMTLTRSSGLLLHPQMPQLGEGNPNKHYINHTPVSQLQSASATAVGGCNGAAKPRVRARRGQATDPHSIAERLRREKIAERMKNLQELVPNTNKTDKASMLDEIIEYVKFLQLQVKVLSMSRLGATGAVVPLITDGQSEGSGGLLLMPPAGQGADLSESLDNIAFEQEVVTLMESNVTMAMQFLQSKGLCLMPIALAAAISGGNASSGLIYSENKKPSFTSGVILHNGSPDVGTQQMSSDGEIVSHNNKVITTNGCSEAAVKQESRALNGIQEKSNPKT